MTACKGCEQGLATLMLDEDGTRTDISKRQGTPSHAVDDAWWPCSNWMSASGRLPALPQSEICICAAIQLVDGRVIRGHRHDDCIHTAMKWRADPKESKQGFMTSRNRFVGRHEGMALQQAAGIASAHGYRGDILFSEDLY